MKNFAVALVVLALYSLSLAATPTASKIDTQKEAAAGVAQKAAAAGAQVGRNATSACSFTLTSGANNTYLKYCVTVNGNIPQIQTPLGHEHISIGSFGEGYGVCDTTTNVEYYDYADFGDSGNWGASVITHPSAPVVKVVRSTSDGIWTLTQTITQVGGTSSIKVAMALKNNTAIARTAYLMRYADVDADGILLNNQDGTLNSAFSWNSVGGSNPYGLTLQTVGTSPFSYAGFAQNTPFGPPPCNYTANFTSGVLTATDGSLVSIYIVPVPKNASKTVTVSYKGL